MCADLAWNGGSNGGNTKSFVLINGQDVNSPATFSMRFYGKNVDWTTPTSSGTFASTTGLDGTYRQVLLAYNPLTGYCYGKLGKETVFTTNTTRSLTVQSIRFSTVFPSGIYDPGTLSIDNTSAEVTSVQIPGDANNDGMVDVGDLGILAANYGGTNKTWFQGDFNGDGKVDVGDLGILAANYGTGTGSAQDFAADYAKIFGSNISSVDTDNIAEDIDDTAEGATSTICNSLGLSLVAGLVMMGVMLVKSKD